VQVDGVKAVLDAALQPLVEDGLDRLLRALS